MIINSDINVLGSIKDYGIISLLLNNNSDKVNYSGNIGYNFKTSKSFNRMRDALLSTVVKIDNPDYRDLIKVVFPAPFLPNKPYTPYSDIDKLTFDKILLFEFLYLKLKSLTVNNDINFLNKNINLNLPAL